jgi:DNA-binding MarR family transcriptional regulator
MAIEKVVQRRFAERFGTSLPRFDVLAALDRHPGGMAMGALSRALLVSSGNVTQIVQKLVADGLVELAPSPTDRRSSIARLTPQGVAHFTALADAHHAWIDELLAGVDPELRERLHAGLGTLKTSIARGSALEP